jgi:transposase
MASELVIESLHKMIGELKAEEKRLEQQIDDHIDRHPHLKKDRKLLESIPSVGKVLSRVMLSVIRSRDFSKASQVAAYLGLIPVQQESGVFRGRSRLSKTGPAKVRSKLYMGAIVAWKYNSDLIAHKERLLANGKTTMQALCATMRKLVHMCFGVLKHQTVYQPQVT